MANKDSVPPREQRIRATEYTRDDGTTLHQLPSGNWVLRCILGPAWFWNPDTRRWDPASGIKSLDEYELPFEQAYPLLGTVPKNTLQKTG
jgi:hypothetical protein